MPKTKISFSYAYTCFPYIQDSIFETNFQDTKKLSNQCLRVLVEMKAAKTHTVLYQINRTEYYCQVDLPLSDYPLYGKQLVASRG